MRSPDQDRVLKHGLERGRLLKLQSIEEQMIELNEDFRAAQDGLAIAQRNPGEIAHDVIEYLGDKLNNSATELNRLGKEHQELLEMDFPRLLMTFQRVRRG